MSVNTHINFNARNALQYAMHTDSVRRFPDHECHRAGDPSSHLLAHVATNAFDSDQQGDASKCHPNTRKAVLDEIMNWIAQGIVCVQFVLWLNGAAGAGKSAIARSIVEMCIENDILLARFFFFRTDPSRNTITPLVATLVHQLIGHLPELEGIIIPRLSSNPLIFNKSLKTQFHYLIFEPLLQLKTESQFQQTILLLFDGLDECSVHINQANIITIVAQFVQANDFPLIALYCSRAEPQLKEAFRSADVSKILHQLPLDDHYLPDDDIRLFLNDSFSRIKETHSLSYDLDPDWPPQSDVAALVSKSSGQFIFASVVVQFVSAPRSHPRRQLEIVRGLSPVGLTRPFAQLDALYRHIFSEAQDIDVVLRILAVCILNNIEAVAQCADIGGIAVADALGALMDVTSVIEIDKGPRGSGRIKFLHASLPDFLLDETRSLEYYAGKPQIRADLCARILQILAPHNFDDYSGPLINMLPGAACTEVLKTRISAFRPFDSPLYWPKYYLPAIKQLDFNDGGELYRQQVFHVWNISENRPEYRTNTQNHAKLVKYPARDILPERIMEDTSNVLVEHIKSEPPRDAQRELPKVGVNKLFRRWFRR